MRVIVFNSIFFFFVFGIVVRRSLRIEEEVDFWGSVVWKEGGYKYFEYLNYFFFFLIWELVIVFCLKIVKLVK